MNSLRVTIAWLDAIACFATAAAVASYFVLGIDHVGSYGGVAISLIQHGKFIAIGYIALEMLSGALGEGGNSPLYWLSYLASATVCLVTTLVAGWVFLGMQQNDQMIVQLLAVPYAKDLLIVLLVFSWFSLIVLQGHKHASAWQHVTAARAIAPPAPIPPTIPTAVAAPPVPGSAASVVITILLLLFIAALALATIGGKFQVTFNRAADADGYSTRKEECSIKSRTKVGEMKNGAPIYVIEPGDC